LASNLTHFIWSTTTWRYTHIFFIGKRKRQVAWKLLESQAVKSHGAHRLIFLRLTCYSHCTKGSFNIHRPSPVLTGLRLTHLGSKFHGKRKIYRELSLSGLVLQQGHGMPCPAIDLGAIKRFSAVFGDVAAM
jgi:hypothetical protein